MLIFLNQHKKGAEPAFVPFAFKKRLNDTHWTIGVFLSDLSRLRYCHSKELVALAIFTFPGLEKSWENDLLLLVRQ